MHPALLASLPSLLLLLPPLIPLASLWMLPARRGRQMERHAIHVKRPHGHAIQRPCCRHRMRVGRLWVGCEEESGSLVVLWRGRSKRRCVGLQSLVPFQGGGVRPAALPHLGS
ncbi:hypothetical protein V8C86DRAFT_2608765 [Haematococcus lacustris]